MAQSPAKKPTRSLSKIRLLYCGCTGFGQIFRSFSFNSHHYSPQTIEKSDSNQHNLVTIANLGQAPRECSKKPILPEGFVQICPERSRKKGCGRFDARSICVVRERQRREERQVCEPEGGKRATMSGRSQGTPLAALRPDSGQACFNIPYVWNAKEEAARDAVATHFMDKAMIIERSREKERGVKKNLQTSEVR